MKTKLFFFLRRKQLFCSCGNWLLSMLDIRKVQAGKGISLLLIHMDVSQNSRDGCWICLIWLTVLQSEVYLMLVQRNRYPRKYKPFFLCTEGKGQLHLHVLFSVMGQIGLTYSLKIMFECSSGNPKNTYSTHTCISSYTFITTNCTLTKNTEIIYNKISQILKKNT